MGIWIILSTISPKAFDEPKEFKKIAQEVAERLRTECPGVKWKSSYSTIGHYDAVDIVEADDAAEVAKASMIIRAHGHAATETLEAIPWEEFLESV
jgi:uncharacterized protein with GYD domain